MYHSFTDLTSDTVPVGGLVPELSPPTLSFKGSFGVTNLIAAMAIDPRVCGRLKNISDKELCALSLTGTSTTDSLTDGLSILFCIWLVEKTLFIKQIVQIFRYQ